MPDDLLGHAFAPDPPSPVNSPGQLPTADTSTSEPIIEHLPDPAGQGDGANVAALADQIHNGPMPLSLLGMVERQLDDFVPAKAAR